MEVHEITERTYYTGYRSTFKFRVASGQQPCHLVREYIRTWLIRLAPDSSEVLAWDGVSDLELPGGIYAQGIHDASIPAGAFRVYLPETLALADSGDDSSVGVPGAVRLRDVGDGQRYHRTTFYVFPGTLHGRPAASLLIQGATDDDNILQAIDEYEIPSVIGDILRTRKCFEGDTRLLADSELLDRKTVKRALDAVLDPDRTISVVVASSPTVEGDEAFLRVNRSLMRRCLGTATAYVLPANAVETFNSRLPDHLQVPSGDIRTFLPHADVLDPLPGVRHRYLGPETVARSLDENLRVQGTLPTLHARLPRRQMLEQPLGEELLSLRAKVDRQARRGRISSLVRSKLVRRERESAERGLGPQGEASFDTRLLADVDQIPTGVLRAEPTDDLEQFLVSEHQTEVLIEQHTEPPQSQDHIAEPEVEQQVERTAVDDRPELNKQVTGPQRIVSFLRRWLYPHAHEDVAEETVDVKIIEVDDVLVSKEDEHEAALELLDGAEKEIEDLSSALSDSARELADARAEAALAQEEANEHSSKLAFYRKELIAARRFEALEKQTEAADEWSVTHNLHAIAGILTDDPRGEEIRKYVVFTGDLATLDAVAQRDTHGQYASAAWSFVHTLHDFAKLRATGKKISVDMYLRHDELEGHKVSVHRHAVHESDTVRNREDLRRLREFPVPTSVDPSGKVLMESHFRIGSGDGFAPRLYYFDNTGADGRVYVGYIGRHPKNLLTN